MKALVNHSNPNYLSASDKAEKLLKLPKLGKDDTFKFGCEQCGRCCREREDILLTPLDLFKIAKHLKQSIADVLDDYCEFYEGRDSKIPVVRIKPREYRNTCPFSQKGRCIVHSVKPCICALFPLGRMTNAETGEFSYFIQDVPCGNKNQSQTVREWLAEFSMLEEEEFTILWHKKAAELSEIMREVYSKINFNHDSVNSALFLNLYLRYDLEKDFMPQFTENCEEALRVAKIVSGEAKNWEVNRVAELV